MEMYHDFYLGHEKSVENVVKHGVSFDGYWRKERKIYYENKKNKKSERMVFTGYTDAPPEIEKRNGRRCTRQGFPATSRKTCAESISEKERKLPMKAWKRYRIKNHGARHRKPLAETLKEPTARLDTSIILPRRVYNWIGTKQNKAAFIREMMIKSYKRLFTEIQSDRDVRIRKIITVCTES